LNGEHLLCTFQVLLNAAAANWYSVRDLEILGDLAKGCAQIFQLLDFSRETCELSTLSFLSFFSQKLMY
jgi:hypothetical protein